MQNYPLLQICYVSTKEIYKFGISFKHLSNLKLKIREFPCGLVVGFYSALSLLWAQVQSMVGGLKSHKLCGLAKKKVITIIIKFKK